MTKTPLYRQAIAQSWQLAWHNKFLWIFGLFATFLGQMGILELFIKVGLTGSRYAFFPNWLILPEYFSLPRLFGRSVSMPIEGWLWLVCLALIFIGFGLMLVFVSVSSQGALVHASAQFAKKNKAPNIDQAWHAGMDHFWRLFFLNLFKKIVLFVLAVIMGYAMVNVLIQGTVSDAIIFVLLFVLVSVVGLVLSFWTVYAAGYVVVEEYKLGRAISSAWRLFTEHWLVSIEAGLIILFLNVVLGAVVLSSFFLLFIPTLLLWLLAVSFVSATLYYVAMFIGIALFLLFVVFVGSVFSIFTTSVWTYLFTKMHKHGVTSRLLHWGGFHR